MRPKQCTTTGESDLFRARLDQIINLKHDLVQLAGKCAISKRGERTLRRLLIIGASAVTQQARRRGAPQGSWLARMLARKLPMLVIYNNHH
jgi:transposase